MKKKLYELSNLRYQTEISGISVGGCIIKTDRESQSLIMGAYVAAKGGLVSVIDFKSESGWIQLTSEDAITLGEVLYNHVQGCFTTEKTHYNNIMELVDLGDIVGLASYDLNNGW